MKALRKDSLYANELSANFQQIQENYRYINFIETLPYKKIGLVSWLSLLAPFTKLIICINIKVVEKRSAILGLPASRETVVALNASHSEICRFASEDDEGYQRVSQLIADLASSAIQNVMEPSLPNSPNYSESTMLVDHLEAGFCKMSKKKRLGCWTTNR